MLLPIFRSRTHYHSMGPTAACIPGIATKNPWWFNQQHCIPAPDSASLCCPFSTLFRSDWPHTRLVFPDRRGCGLANVLYCGNSQSKAHHRQNLAFSRIQHTLPCTSVSSKPKGRRCEDRPEIGLLSTVGPSRVNLALSSGSPCMFFLYMLAT